MVSNCIDDVLKKYITCFDLVLLLQRTISESHQYMAGQRPSNHLDTPGYVDHRSAVLRHLLASFVASALTRCDQCRVCFFNRGMKEFTASWRPPVNQRRTHTIRDLA